MTYKRYHGTASQYIAEYLDPMGTLQDSPPTEEEARGIWASLEEVFADDGGTGMSEDDFVEAVARQADTETGEIDLMP